MNTTSPVQPQVPTDRELKLADRYTRWQQNERTPASLAMLQAAYKVAAYRRSQGVSA